MPFLNLQVAGDLPNATKTRLQRRLTELMASVLRKKAEVTAVLVQTVPAESWSVNGTLSSPAAHLDVKVTAGTNDAAEKARFVHEAYALLSEELGALPVATYVVIHEVPGDAWGFSGLTQAERASRARAA